MLPMSYVNYFAKASMTHNDHTREASLYRPIKIRTNLRAFSIKALGAQIWNSIPLHIQTAQNRRQFKILLKEFLLTTYPSTPA